MILINPIDLHKRKDANIKDTLATSRNM
jgi:hypothetical protein